MNYFIYKQLPLLPPVAYDQVSSWDHSRRIDAWIEARVVELSCNAKDMSDLGSDLGYQGAPFVWNGDRRAVLRAELDAAFFHLYGIERADVDYIMDTFPIVRRKDETKFGEYRTKRLILEAYIDMAEASVTGEPFVSRLDPPPGHGRRHPPRSDYGR